MIFERFDEAVVEEILNGVMPKDAKVTLFWDGHMERVVVYAGGRAWGYAVSPYDVTRLHSPDPERRWRGMNALYVPAAQWAHRVLTLDRGPYG